MTDVLTATIQTTITASDGRIATVTQSGQVTVIASTTPFPNPGGGGGGATQVFIQDDEPEVEAGVAFAWLKTGLGDGSDFEFIMGKGQ